MSVGKSVFGFVVILTLMLVAQQASGQQSAVYSQYAFNRLAFNPAYAGSQDQLNISAVHRRQWENFEGAPTTSMLNFHKPLQGKNIGLGMWASSESIGVHKDTRVYAAYAYKIKMKKGTLSMGLQAGFSKLSSDYTKLNLKSNDAVLSGFQSAFNPNFGAGLYYSTQSFYTGISVPYLLNNNIAGSEQSPSTAREARYYFLTIGKVVKLNQDVKMMPSAMVRVHEGNASGIDMGVNFILKDLLTVGAVYRSQDALVALMQLSLSENLIMGYSYDYTTSAINQYSNGSHEMMLSYRIPYAKLCHTYF